MEKVYIDKRAVELAHYIITTKDTVRGAARKFGVSKSTVHTEVTLRNGYELENVAANIVRHIPESIAIKKVFLVEKNPVVKMSLLVS